MTRAHFNPRPPPPFPGALPLQAIIPDKASAIAFDGGAGDKCRLILDLFSEQPAELLKLLKLRGERLIVTFVKEDDIQRSEL